MDPDIQRNDDVLLVEVDDTFGKGYRNRILLGQHPGYT